MDARALLLAAVLLTAACTGDGGSEAGTGPGVEQQPQPFRAADPTTPDGATVVQCSDLRSQHGTGMAVRFALPAEFGPGTRDGGTCDFSGDGFGRELTVSFGPMESLASVKERDLDPDEDVGGDDSVSDIAYDEDVPVFGSHHGERLEWYCYCDGQDLDERVLQARGVRVHWTTPHRKDPRLAELDAVRAGLALVRSDTSTCTAHGRTATFRPPIPRTESIDSSGPGCHLYLQPGRASLQRYAQVVPAPARTLPEIAASLRGRGHVSGVHLAGDRLTWRWTRDEAGELGEPAGTWRAVTVAGRGVQVTWSATPGQWRREADVVRRFVDSVRLLPAD
ncbi:hypothetical protein [Nocardioides mangrovi]|uniref:DUF3558 domain-containing protein n=1 Tax=Nocardioides mangrovi TaxID=2874580 RepID=A0ABS7UIP0_9ACTN|nr:hypothetical protein [Nocardioides mangrovi]MBZ5740457.1 hypothetical protein [Nocardioides mangrovi]